MKQIKIVTVVGTRPEIIRLSSVINRLNASAFIDHTLIHTGQNYDYELNEIFFNELEIKKPNYFLNAAGKNAASTIGNVIYKVDEVFEKDLKVMDMTAFTLCQENELPIVVFNMNTKGNLQKIVDEEKIGTIVK